MSKLLIVGGSRGIGRAILEEQVERQPVVNISRTQPDVHHPNLEHFPADVLTDDLPDLDGITGIIYCPGSITLKPIRSLKAEDFERDFRINVVGAAKVIKKYVRTLQKAEDASIVLFSTVAVEQGMPFHSSVAAAKAGVEALTRTLAAELAPKVRVNCIAPTITDTDLASNLLKNEEARERMADRHPLKRILVPSDVASLAGYLISPAAAGMSGQVLGLDGGLSRLRS